MFDPVDPKQSLPDLEEGILQYWREEDTFKRSMRRVSGDKLNNGGTGKEETYSFYDGPPFATGLPHYGHLLAGTIKDVIPRYHTMRGKSVERRFGWDCHGLPVENLIEKENDIADKAAIEEMGVGAFNDLCRASVQRYTDEWRKTVERMGRWVDMDWDYKTMDPQFMESIWWAFAELHKKGLIYEGRKSMHVCPRCATPLSNFEVTLGYQDVSDWTTFTKYPLVDDPKTVLLAWTTTTWTLPGNLFLAVGKDISYAKVQEEGSDVTYVLAEALVEKVFDGKEYNVVETLKAKDLVGKKYEPLLPYFVDAYKDQNAFRVVEGDFVTTEDGTGIVHIAPGFGTDDYELGKREGVEVLSHVRIDGTLIDEVTDFAGQEVKPKDDPTKTDKKISKKLEEMSRLFKAESYKHSYPHCWRCDSPLINYSTASWFVAVDEIKTKMLDANAKTEWVPSHVRDGRFGRWLENARDWAISRNRYWGTPLPIWRTEDGSDVTVIGSRDELMANKKIRFTKVTALRHAESEGNLIPIYQGEMPGTDLTKHGKGQAKDVGTWLKTQNVDVIYCSPLARAQQTAEAIAKKTGAKVVVDERLREVAFGEWEGKTVDFSDLTFVKERRAHKLESGKPESIYHFDGMEKWESVYERISSFLEEMLPKHRSEHVVVVTHADPMINIEHFFTGEDPVKLSHRPYPEKATPKQYFWDHKREKQMDLHMDSVDDISWPGSKSDASVEVTMVRHGETDWNKEKKIQGGECDIPLNENGKAQIHELAKKLKGKKFDYIVASDLKRTRETAEILSKELGVPLEEPLPILRERNIGNWGGMTLVDINEMQPAPVETTNGVIRNCTPEGGESFDEYLTRVEEATDVILEKYAGKSILIAGHRGNMQFNRIVSQNLSYREARDYTPDNGSSESFTMNPRIRRIPEVLDCWFESGSMPYAQEHYPFEMKHHKTKEPPDFPANFIAEGMDQTRGWFYTLTVLGAALFGKSPFEHCVVNGTVLAEDGKKMSKRLRNYPDPLEVVDKHGADAIRFSLMSSPAVRGEDLRFSEKLVEENMRNVLLPLWNTYSFFVTYANAANFEPVDSRTHSTHPLDIWIRAEVQDLANRMTKELDAYDLSATCNELHETIDALTNWYVRLSRRRFAGKESPEAQHDAMMTLYDVLLTLSQLLAPFCPYITEAIYLNLVPEDHGSVHLTDWPDSKDLSDGEKNLLDKTRVMRQIVSLGNGIRGEAKVKTRQPLASATVALPPSLKVDLNSDDLHLLQQELNVKMVEFAEDPDELAESFVQVDARKVGPRLGGRVQEIIKAGKEGEFTVQDDGRILILDEVLTPEEAVLTYRGKEGQDAAADKGVVVSLDTTISDELMIEGKARDIVRGVQRVRKEQGLEFTDDITLKIDGADDVIEAHKDLITSETRSELGDASGDSHTIEVGDGEVTICFTKR